MFLSCVLEIRCQGSSACGAAPLCGSLQTPEFARSLLRQFAWQDLQIQCTFSPLWCVLCYSVVHDIFELFPSLDFLGLQLFLSLSFFFRWGVVQKNAIQRSVLQQRAHEREKAWTAEKAWGVKEVALAIYIFSSPWLMDNNRSSPKALYINIFLRAVVRGVDG